MVCPVNSSGWAAKLLVNCIGDAGAGPGPGYALEEMNQVWHLFRYDVKRSWPLLAGWLAFLLVAFAWVLPDPLGRERLDEAADYALWVEILYGLAVVTGTAMVFVADSPVGERPFRKTRPVSRPALLAAKTLFVSAVFIVVPLVLNLLWSLRFGMQAADWAPVGLSQALSVALWLPFAAALASLVRSFAAFMAWLLGLAVASWFGVIALTAVSQTWLESSVNTVHSQAALEGALVLSWGAQALLGLVVVVLQYLTRNRPRVIGVALAGWALLLVAPFSAPELFASWAPRPESPLERPLRAALVSSQTRAPVFPASRLEENMYAPTRVSVRLQVEGLAADEVIVNPVLGGVASWPGRLGFDLYGDRSEAIVYSEPGMGNLRSFPQVPPSFVMTFNLGSGRDPAPMEQAGRLRGTLSGQVARIRYLGSCPLKRDASIDAGAHRAVVRRYIQSASGLALTIRHQFLRTERTPWAPIAAVVNPSRGEHLSGVMSLSKGPYALYAFGAGRRFIFNLPSLVATDVEVKTPLRYFTEDGNATAAAGWLEGAELQLFELESVGRIEVPVEVDGFQLTATGAR